MRNRIFKRLPFAIASLTVAFMFVAIGCSKKDVEPSTSSTVKAQPVKQSISANKYADKLKSVGFMPYNEPIPVQTFAVEGIDGTDFSTEQLKGKITILNFWAPWCPPCRQEMPHIDSFYKKFKDVDGFQFIAIAIRDKKDSIKKFLKDNDYSFPSYFDENVRNVAPYVTQGIPVTYIVDKNAQILGGFIGPYNFDSDEFDKFIRELL